MNRTEKKIHPAKRTSTQYRWTFKNIFQTKKNSQSSTCQINEQEFQHIINVSEKWHDANCHPLGNLPCAEAQLFYRHSRAVATHLHHASTSRQHPRRPHCRIGAGNSSAKSQNRIADGGIEREMIFDKK